MKKITLSFPILISMVVGNMIGTGIYILPASLAGFGTISLFAWLFTSLGAIFLSLTFAHLNASFPQTGGPYIYCKQAFGKLCGFIIAYTYWICNLASIAGIAVASVGYLGFITPHLNANTTLYQPYFALSIELLIIWFFTLVNILGLHTAGKIQVILTLIKVAPLLLIAALGLFKIKFSNLSEFNLTSQSDISVICKAAALTFWAFIGLESATIPAENANTKDVFRATIWGALIVALIYISTTFVLMGMIPSLHLKNSQFPFAEVGTLLFGSHAAVIIAICAVISGFAALNVSLLIQGQLIFACARDKFFPKFLVNTSRNFSPLRGQLFSSTLISLFLIMTVQPTLLHQFNHIALQVGLLTLLIYFMTTVAQIKLLITQHHWNKQLFLNKSLLVSVIAMSYVGWMLTNYDGRFIYISAALMGLAIPLYFLRRLPAKLDIKS